MEATTPKTTTPNTPAPNFERGRTQAIEAVSAWAKVTESVLAKMVELSAKTASEAIRTYAELQAASIDAVRRPSYEMPAGSGTAFNPLDWYQRSMQSAVQGTERYAALMETQAQILARGSDRVQTAVQTAGSDVRGAVETYVNRMKEIYSTN
jgi:hypothetical protein